MKQFVSIARISISILLIVTVLVISCTASKQNQNGHLIIKEQGSFSAGGTVVKSEGTFDALKPWNVQQGGQTRHGDHADVFYQLFRPKVE